MRPNFEIKAPRYKDNSVLLARYKVIKGTNVIKFTEAKHLKEMLFEVDSSDIEVCSKQINKTKLCKAIEVYIVPMELLKRIN